MRRWWCHNLLLALYRFRGFFLPNSPFRIGLTIDRSLHGLPPIRRSNGPHSANCSTDILILLEVCSHWFGGKRCHPAAAGTHVFPGDGANVVDVFDLSLVLDHPHGDRILTDLWSDVALDFEAQVFENQVSCGDVSVVRVWTFTLNVFLWSKLNINIVSHLYFVVCSGQLFIIFSYIYDSCQ